MKKKIIILSFSIILIIGLLIMITNSNKNVYTDIDGIKYAILVNGSSATSFPNGDYKVNIGCTNAYGYWDSITNKAIIKNIKGNVTCDISFNSINSSDYLNTYLIGLSGTTQGEGQMILENGYRFEGKNPNNYIMFNNELWRIIGVFSTEYDSDDDGTTDTTTNLVKIIRENIIGGLAWNKSYNNNWINSSLYHLLNEQYYDWETNKASVSTYCYGYLTSPTTCDYSIKGIQDGYREMIVKTKWYLGGGGKSGYNTYIPDNIYSYERDANAVYSGRNASITQYIGLMYESDYLYAVLESNCARTTTHSSYDNNNCAGKNWLFGKGIEWTITHLSINGDAVWRLEYNGNMRSDNSAFYGHGVRPTLYLSPSVYKVGGTGTLNDPYIIGMPSS